MPGFYSFLPTPTYRSNRLARACSFPNPGLHTEDTSRWTKALLSSSLKRLLFRREISTRIRGLNRPRVSRGRSKLSKSRRPESVYVAGPQLQTIFEPRIAHIITRLSRKTSKTHKDLFLPAVRRVRTLPNRSIQTIFDFRITCIATSQRLPFGGIDSSPSVVRRSPSSQDNCHRAISVPYDISV